MACLVGLDFIRSRLSGEPLEVLALALEMRLCCGGKLVSRDGEVVCSHCGLVCSVENSADHVHFPEHESLDGGRTRLESGRYLKVDVDDLELARMLDKVKDKWNPQAKNRTATPSLP